MKIKTFSDKQKLKYLTNRPTSKKKKEEKKKLNKISRQKENDPR